MVECFVWVKTGCCSMDVDLILEVELRSAVLELGMCVCLMEGRHDG